MKGRIRCIGISLLLITMVLTGCITNTETSSKQAYKTITDDLGRTVTLPEKPTRIVVLSFDNRRWCRWRNRRSINSYG